LFTGDSADSVVRLGTATNRQKPLVGWRNRPTNRPTSGRAVWRTAPPIARPLTSRGRCPCGGEGWSASAIASLTERRSSSRILHADWTSSAGACALVAKSRCVPTRGPCRFRPCAHIEPMT